MLSVKLQFRDLANGARTHCFWCGAQLHKCAVCNSTGMYKNHMCYPCNGLGLLCLNHGSKWEIIQFGS